MHLPGSFSTISKTSITAPASSGGKDAEKTYPCPDNLWWSMTYARPQQKPPREAMEFSKLPAMRSIFSIWNNAPLLYQMTKPCCRSYGVPYREITTCRKVLQAAVPIWRSTVRSSIWNLHETFVSKNSNLLFPKKIFCFRNNKHRRLTLRLSNSTFNVWRKTLLHTVEMTKKHCCT